jgi:hypothetical protein
MLVRLSKPYEAKYYENAPHVLLRKNNASYSDAMNQSVVFLRKYLGQ